MHADSTPPAEPYGRDYFDEWYADRPWQAYSWLIAIVVRESQPGPVLDLGAGTGLMVEGLQRWGIPASGLEGSAAGVEAGLSRYGALDIRQHDLAEKLPVADASQATVVLNQVIEHLEPPVGVAVLRECHRVLRPGGVLVLTAPSRYNKYERLTDPTHVNMMSPRELRAVLRAAGFQRVVPFDEPLAFLGPTKTLRRLAKLLFLVRPIGRLSATTNVIAHA